MSKISNNCPAVFSNLNNPTNLSYPTNPSNPPNLTNPNNNKSCQN